MGHTKSDPKRVFEVACCFRQTAAHLITEQRHGTRPEFHYPSLVNLAFAAELYLKCLLQREKGAAPHTHQLTVLYQRLNGRDRTAIERRFDQEVLKNPLARKLQAADPKFDYSLSRVLQATSNAFEEWRYIFEERQYTVLFYGMEEFCDAVQAYIISLEPDWETAI